MALSLEEILRRQQNAQTQKSLGIGFNFGKTLVSELQTVQNTNLTLEEEMNKVNRDTDMAERQLSSEYANLSQNDIVRAMSAGVDLNSGTVAQVASARRELFSQQQQRLWNIQRQQQELINRKSSNAQSHTVENIGLGLIGAFLGWLFV